MKRVVLAIDGQHFDKSVFQYLEHLHGLAPICLVGLVLPVVDHTEVLYTFGGVISGPMYVNEVNMPDPKITDEVLQECMAFCSRTGIAFSEERCSTKDILDSIHHASMYADLVVISAAGFYDKLHGAHTKYLEGAMHRAACPVVLVPKGYYVPQNVILTYDGSENSLRAIKYFSYLFPGYERLNPLLVYFGDDAEELPNAHAARDFISCHFPNVSITRLQMHDKEQILNWLKSNEHPVVVAGAYARSMLSEFLKRSFIHDAIAESELMLFIAH